MATTPTYINQRINNLQSQINDIISGGGVPTSSDLAVVLVNGNSAGATKLNMNNNDIIIRFIIIMQMINDHYHIVYHHTSPQHPFIR